MVFWDFDKTCLYLPAVIPVMDKNEQKSMFAELLAFLATVRGDLSNVTSPPQYLAPVSFTELCSSWTQRPSLFIAPALEADPLQRALRVLEWWICALKFQYYVGMDPSVGLKKPLNAFLGELFLGEWTDKAGTTKALVEQVSHHPPIVASYLSSEEHGVNFRGYSRSEMTFNGSFNVKHTGHGILHLDKYDEDYLLPLPTCRVKGFLSRKLYPELVGTHHIISSSGYISEITFTSEGYFSGLRNSFRAKLYKESDERKEALYTLAGQWNGEFVVRDRHNVHIEKRHVDSPRTSALQMADIDNQDPWESRRAWRYVLDSIKNGDMRGTVREKSKLEEAQRAMRRKDVRQGVTWEPRFFTSQSGDEVFSRLAAKTGLRLHADKTKGVWRLDEAKAQKASKPYHGKTTPFGEAVDD